MAYIYKTGRAELHEQIKRHADLVHGRVLDIGAGSYPRYKSLFTYSEYMAMDIEKGAGIDAVGTIQAIPFPEHSFDSVVCTQVLGDVFELQTAFSELYRVLKPSGTVLITENLFDVLHDEPYDFWRFTEHSLRRLALDAGFEIEVLERRGGYWSVMAQLKTRYWIERLNAQKKWFAWIVSIWSKFFGTIARFLDRHDTSRANKIFTHGFLLIARKK